MVQDRVLELLESADWKDIGFRLTHHAIWRARRYTWRSGSPDKLPGGKTPQDIACAAIEKVWTGARNWDPDRYPQLLTHLRKIVDSDLNHLLSSTEHQKTKRPPETEAGAEIEVPDKAPNPEEQLIAMEDSNFQDKIRDKFYAMVEGDEDLETILLCFDEGTDKPQDIAKEAGWDVSKVNNTKRRLFRKAAKLRLFILKEAK